MSTASTDSSGSNPGLNQILSQLPTDHHNNAVGVTESHVNPSLTNRIPTNDSTWINKFYSLDRLFSGGLLHCSYRIIDIALLLVGLISNKPKCNLSNHLAVTAICLLIFYFIDLIIIAIFFIRNMTQRNSSLSEEQKLEQLRRASIVRGFFMFFKIIPVCFGTGYSFSSSLPDSNDCELMRFCLGVVCLSTWLIILIPPTKPELPIRRTLLAECFILSFVLIINCSYIGTVANAISNVHNSSCIYNNAEDLYLGAPLKSYAFAGLLLFSCATLIHIINLIINQIYFRLNRQRQFYVYYYGLQYFLNYSGAIIVIYYFSIGGLFLFQPRSGQTCRQYAPDLYKILLIWEWIRILSPLFVVPLLMILCCLGVFFGIILSYCLPASITVPILELLQEWRSAAPMAMNPNPPATQENIDSVPIVLFSQESNQFNQTDCAICRTDFESNEELKKLHCGHLFHPECVANWLRITRICPICRQRMSLTNP
ncbi:unnamed protein product [Rotaria socialis]|uniref:RING-type domain-containing protein n=1 Tax=Rotaria socialis TaxID=392032 RepID=A0A820D2Y3_9BILA|nr:unnamed protein product [Rotaria socialis]CAF3505090.1 unnamed protein product [Rotaria socialis]CAF3788654.1 unnamed protein product [Rotaria socialis]CAF4225007.1 unnamed protein product [Rotaria socialis]CAF4461618.1 unnamed protein product [Rotaria socialis]